MNNNNNNNTNTFKSMSFIQRYSNYPLKNEEIGVPVLKDSIQLAPLVYGFNSDGGLFFKDNLDGWKLKEKSTGVMQGHVAQIRRANAGILTMEQFALSALLSTHRLTPSVDPLNAIKAKRLNHPLQLVRESEYPSRQKHGTASVNSVNNNNKPLLNKNYGYLSSLHPAEIKWLARSPLLSSDRIIKGRILSRVDKGYLVSLCGYLGYLPDTESKTMLSAQNLSFKHSIRDAHTLLEADTLIASRGLKGRRLTQHSEKSLKNRMRATQMSATQMRYTQSNKYNNNNNNNHNNNHNQSRRDLKLKSNISISALRRPVALRVNTLKFKLDLPLSFKILQVAQVEHIPVQKRIRGVSPNLPVNATSFIFILSQKALYNAVCNKVDNVCSAKIN